MERIETEEQYRNLIDGQEYTVIKFDTNWCPDCKTLDRFMGDIIDQNPEKRFFAMDAEKFQDLAEQNEVRGIPSLLVYRGGEKIAHLHSKFAKTPAQVSEYLAEIK
ncbi:thioredoxin family protein [Paenibacillus hunanensis]|uniref:Thiol-disulfide isomerase/thioredoxin n=1 Tax=Paenibacillus hunanensis TaxID=539262 RepID=A0ABU1J192_9BACL|nr:thioredoxin family protein [Paenibacillus hunanensis]MCL9662368.1 thioredoxin family protein [Paenibacillus hunanensis]MDR6245274.1 thiol-disulfide isomerase/thioredoxin [Paenibacillus hunanensis]GGJ26844.1 thiol reductase thioredoxin [Paenibacillus hunanensis]